MAKQVDSKFLIIEGEPTEFINMLNKPFVSEKNSFSPVNLYCDWCGKEIFSSSDDPCYYIAILNSIYCKDCYEDFCKKHTNPHLEDKPFELKNFNYYKTLLKMK